MSLTPHLSAFLAITLVLHSWRSVEGLPTVTYTQSVSLSDWPGVWQGPEGNTLSVCMDNNGNMNAIFSSTTQGANWGISGTLSSSNTKVTGTCSALPSNYFINAPNLTNAYIPPRLWAGTMISFSVPPVNPVDITVRNSSGGIVFQKTAVFPGPPVAWVTDPKMVSQTFTLTTSAMGFTWNTQLNFQGVGTYFYAQIDSRFIQLQWTCTYTVIPESQLFKGGPSFNKDFVNFFPVSNYASAIQCGDIVQLWVGVWRLSINNLFWDRSIMQLWVCSSGQSLVVSFGNAANIWNGETYYLTSDLQISPLRLQGKFYKNNDTSIHGTFDFQQGGNSTGTGFTGSLTYNGIPYPISGAVVTSSAPYDFLCSPFSRYDGVYRETLYSSDLYMCFNGNIVEGSFFGKSVVFTGHFVEDDKRQYLLYIEGTYLRTGEHFNYTLYLELNKHEQILWVADNYIQTPYGTILANSLSKSIVSCESVPILWGVFRDSLFDSHLFLCSGPANGVFGVINDTFSFVGTADGNVVTGTVTTPDGTYTFIWDFPTSNGNVSGQYIDENGVIVPSTITRETNTVSDSQCSGKVLITAFAGSWNLPPSTNKAYICVTSETTAEGQFSPYYFNLDYNQGTLVGSFTNIQTGETGDVQLETSLDEIYIKATINSSTTYITLDGTRDTRSASPDQCRAWEQLYTKSKFSLRNVGDLLGGCFSFCFHRSTFRILFFNSEIYGEGTLDRESGRLKGTLYMDQGPYELYVTTHGTGSINMTMVSPSGFSKSFDYDKCNYGTYPELAAVTTDCVPRRYEPFIRLDVGGPQLPAVSIPPSRKVYQNGSDITADGNTVIVSSKGATFILTKDSQGGWGHYQLPVDQGVVTNISLWSTLAGIPVAITPTHAFVIEGANVSVWTNIAGGWDYIGDLEAPCSPICLPLYLVKSYPEKYLAITWVDTNKVSYPSLYNISNGEVDFTPIGNTSTTYIVISVAVSPYWVVYTTLDSETTTITLVSCPITDPFDTENCFENTLSSGSSKLSLGLGFSVAVSEKYLFVGYPSSQSNSGSVYVYKYTSPLWKRMQILYPPDSGFHQSFGRMVAVRDDKLLVMKPHDNTVAHFSLAFFLYQFSGSSWDVYAKLGSDKWPTLWQSIVPSNNLKRQFIEISPLENVQEPVVLWALSSNQTIFFSTLTLDNLFFARYECDPGYWGFDCSTPCNCSNNAICSNSIAGFSCSCVNNTYGLYCENVCPDCHGAKCSDGALGNGTCLCNDTQWGPTCLPCLCVNGRCSVGPNGTGACFCHPGFSGDLCEVAQEQISPPASNQTTLIIAIAVPCAIVLLILIIAFYCYKVRMQNYGIDITELPEELQWFVDGQRIAKESGWDHKLSADFLSKDAIEDKKYNKRLMDLLENLDGKDISIDSAYAVYNQTLINNFLGYRQVISQRHRTAPQLFKASFKNDRDLREWVQEQYAKRVDLFDWNKDSSKLSIIPTIHGTDLKVATSICGSGFAALSSLDQGYYGKGIYVTSSCMYALPYYAPKPTPSFLICLVTPGNVYPVVENYSEENSYMGKAIKNGFQSHYVITRKDGKAIGDTKPTKKFYDELVLSSESALIPIFLVAVDRNSILKLVKKFERVVVENDRAIAL